LKESIVIIDEFDWLIFDGKPEIISETMNQLAIPCRVIGFSGSAVTAKEAQCLNIMYGIKVVAFPSLAQIEGDNRTSLRDLIITTTKKDYE
jgi:hypothetical protein